MKAIVEHYPPMMAIDEDYKEHAIYFSQNKTYLVNGFTSGLFHDVWQVIGNHLNFTSLFYKPETINWGKVSQLSNGTFTSTGLINDVHHRKVDVAVAPLNIRSPRQEVVTFLPPIYSETMVVALSKSSVKESIEFTGFLRPFHYSLWIIVLTTITVTAFLKMIFFQEKTNMLFNFFKYFWDSTIPMFGGSSKELSNNGSYYVFHITILLCGYIIWISYNAALTSELMVTKNTYPFTDLVSVSSTNWRYTIRLAVKRF